MREPTIARNYAEALFMAGEHSGQTEGFAVLLEALAGAIAADERIQIALDSPRVPKRKKSVVLRRALEAHAPETFLRFLDAVVRRGRQGMFQTIAREYQALVDVKFNRVHAGVVLARRPDEVFEEEIRSRLSEILAKEVIPHIREDRNIIGGIVVRIGDRVMDGSLRTKLKRLRRHMLGA